MAAARDVGFRECRADWPLSWTNGLHFRAGRIPFVTAGSRVGDCSNCKGAASRAGTCFPPEAMNWPDFRIRAAFPKEGEFAWSHGAPGMLLAYNRVARLVEALPALDVFLRNRPAESFARRAMSRPGPVNHSLCHGALGNYIIFRELGVEYEFLRGSRSGTGFSIGPRST